MSGYRTEACQNIGNYIKSTLEIMFMGPREYMRRQDLVASENTPLSESSQQTQEHKSDHAIYLVSGKKVEITLVNFTHQGDTKGWPSQLRDSKIGKAA